MSVVEMETNFILLILFIMLGIFWFVNLTEVKMGSHRKAYGTCVLFIIFSCVFRIFCLYIDFQYQNISVSLLSFVHAGYLSGLMLAYAAYGYLILCLLNNHIRWKKAILFAYFSPVAIAVLLIITSHFTGLIYSADQIYGYQHGVLFFYIYLVPAIYIGPGLGGIIRRRKYLPQNLIKCTVVTMVEFSCGMVILYLTRSKTVLFGLIALCIFIQLFVLLFYDDFWEEITASFNQAAFDFYMRRCLERKKSMNIILIQIVGFDYYKNSRDDESVRNMLNGLAEDLKGMMKVNTVYYLSNGAFSIAFDEDDKVDEKSCIEQIITYCNHPYNKHVEQLSPDIDVSCIRIPKDANDPQVIYSYIDQKTKALEIREEKVRLLEKESLHLEDVFRSDKIIESLRNSIQDNSIEVYYQPIYDLRCGKFSLAEALPRINDPKIGLISLEEFAPLAEKNGMIMEVGTQIFEKVCQFIQEENLKELGIGCMEVNISVGQFLDESLPHKLQSLMEQYQVSFDQIDLEIKEIETSFEESKMRSQLSKMSEMGFRFSLDDYGTGYSNMESVTEYPLRMIKLDKNIVWSAWKNPKAMITLESLVSLFHSLDFEIVAEGVETQELLKKLEQIHIDYIQGAYVSKPLSKDELKTFLSEYQV